MTQCLTESIVGDRICHNDTNVFDDLDDLIFNWNQNSNCLDPSVSWCRLLHISQMILVWLLEKAPFASFYCINGWFDGAGTSLFTHFDNWEGAHIHMFVFTDHKNNRFQKKLIVKNTDIWLIYRGSLLLQTSPFWKYKIIGGKWSRDRYLH